MKSNKLRLEFKKQQKINAIQTVRSVGEITYSLNYVHWLEDKLLEDWISVEDKFPDEEITVLCYHECSKNLFTCYRTKDCLTGEPKWFGDAKPTHWKFVNNPI